MKRYFLSFAIVTIASIALSGMDSRADGLPPGQHTATAKYWPKLGWHVVNYTPFQFDRHIVDLTAGGHGDVWFGVGSSIEHIDGNRDMSVTRMPHEEWIVSGISVVGKNVWFSAGQSGKFGILDDSGVPRFVQAVPRRFNPDLRDVVANNDGETWFVDYGRSSIGYRSASGRLVENPFPRDTSPVRMQHCMGKLWVVSVGSSGGLSVIDDNLRPQRLVLGKLPGYAVDDIACDSLNRLWILRTNYRTAAIERLDSGANSELAPVFDSEGGSIASDLAGGIWMTTETQHWSGPIIHIDSDLAQTRHYLPTEIEGGDSILADANGRIWLAMNGGGAPIAVTEIDTR
ncbi:MAG TPA: hypothetical protein VKT51_05895 [Candidatus Eremiobacteraceae bacterium]|nr:hypothetical protein [Candidatus Eremiobacteraceae bacterium]